MLLLFFVYFFTVYLVMLLLAVTVVLNDRMISEECIGSYRKGSDGGLNCGVS